MESPVSSLIDTWIALSDAVNGGETNRTLMIRKSRGMAHSNQLREFLLTNHGVKLLDPYLGPGGAVMGSARVAQEAKDAAAALARRQDIERRQHELDRKRSDVEHQIAILKRQFEAEKEALQSMIDSERAQEHQAASDRHAMGVSRRSEPVMASRDRRG